MFCLSRKPDLTEASESSLSLIEASSCSCEWPGREVWKEACTSPWFRVITHHEGWKAWKLLLKLTMASLPLETLELEWGADPQAVPHCPFHLWLKSSWAASADPQRLHVSPSVLRVFPICSCCEALWCSAAVITIKENFDFHGLDWQCTGTLDRHT